MRRMLPVLAFGVAVVLAPSRADGCSCGGGGSLPAHVRGSDIARVVRLAAGPGLCLPSFTAGQVWLVYAESRDGRLQSSICGRSRLVDRARADLQYFDGLESGRPQSVVYGEVLRRGFRYEIEPDRSSYDLVLPPGPAMVWVEKDGATVTAPVTVTVTDRGEHHVVLVADYQEQ